MQIEKKYYNQKDVVNAISLKTGGSRGDILRILNSLGDVVKEKFGGEDSFVEIKLFPGLKVTSKYVPSEQSVSSRLKIQSGYSIFMSAAFTDDFRKKVKALHEAAGQHQLIS